MTKIYKNSTYNHLGQDSIESKKIFKMGRKSALSKL